MKIIINHSSMQPIYEQITDQIKAMIIDGTLKEEEMLPSVRTLAKELKISALTVKKAYDFLEEEGFVVTVHGKGSFIAKNNQGLLMEERKREIETELEKVIRKARISGLSEKIPYRIPPATSMIPVEPQKEGNTISYFSSYSISAINLVTTIDKKLVTVKENKRVYVIIHTRSSRLCLLPPVLSQRYITPRSNTIPRSIGPVHTTPAYP